MNEVVEMLRPTARGNSTSNLSDAEPEPKPKPEPEPEPESKDVSPGGAEGGGE